MIKIEIGDDLLLGTFSRIFSIGDCIASKCQQEKQFNFIQFESEIESHGS